MCSPVICHLDSKRYSGPPPFQATPSRHAQRVNDFTQNVLSPYLNFHRPCFFPSETVDAKGRRRKRYRDADIMTPYEKLKSLPEAAVYLTPLRLGELYVAAEDGVHPGQAWRF